MMRFVHHFKAWSNRFETEVAAAALRDWPAKIQRTAVPGGEVSASALGYTGNAIGIVTPLKNSNAYHGAPDVRKVTTAASVLETP